MAADVNSSRGWDVILLLGMKTTKDPINLRNVHNNKCCIVFKKKKESFEALYSVSSFQNFTDKRDA